MPTVSVIVPTHDRAALVRETLLALSQQSDSAFELLVIDHGSCDATADVVAEVGESMKARYVFVPRESASVSIPKMEGAKRAGGEIIIFLDAGMLVPRTYIHAHRAHHAAVSRTVGIGHVYGLDRDDDLWDRTLRQTSREVPLATWDSDPTVRDPRIDVSLGSLPLPWVYAWGGNLSVHRDAFLEAGGFDANHTGWGFEDLDLGYRLWKSGHSFQFVGGGWAAHLPHERHTFEDRIATAWQNWRASYRKHRDLALEAFGCALMSLSEANRTFDILVSLAERIRSLPAPSCLDSMSLGRPSLLVGGTVGEGIHYDYVALADPAFRSQEHAWSCIGILIPLPDYSLGSVVVSDIWQWLGYTPHTDAVPLIEQMIAEIKRTSNRAYFVDVPTEHVPPNACYVSRNDLDVICTKHGLTYELVRGSSG